MLNPGTRFGPYEIVAPLGAGGMGEVYRARDTRLGREVAIKVLPPHLAATPDARARFEREARAISSLNHPNICTLYDVGQHEEADYLVMELVDGETLAKRLERGPLPPDEVIRLGIQVADALDRAHRQSLIHRDLKPGNIMLTKGGAKLLDFGLARATGLSPTVSDLTSTPTVTRPLTSEGTLVGTFQYMSPEQLEGKEADARSDLWALGVTLYEALTGRKAFEGRSQASLIGAIMNSEPPPLSGTMSLAPPALERVIRTCLAKDPDERIQTAHDIRLQLQWVLEGGSQAGVPAPVAARRRRQDTALLVVAAVSTLGFLGMVALQSMQKPPKPQVIRFQISPPTSIQFQDAPRISPDGRYIAYNATDSLGISRIWIRPLEGMTAQPLAGTEGTTRPFWSPDSRYLGFMAGGKLKKIEIGGAPPVIICDAPTGADGSWSRQGLILFDGRAADPIRKVAASGGVATVAIAADSTRGDAQVGWPMFLPDGKHFLYLGIGQQSELWVATVDGKRVKSLGPCDSQITYVEPGYLLYSRGGTLVAQKFDARGLKFTGEPVPVAERVTSDAIGTSEFHASDTGILVFSTRRSQRGRMAVVDRAGRVVRTLAAPASSLNPALSPDGKKIAIRALDDQTRSRDIWIVEPARDITTRFTYETSNENYPVWAPDGRSLYYYSDVAAAPGIYQKELSGTGVIRMVLPWTAGEAILHCVSPDGRTLVFEAPGMQNRSDLYTLSLAGTPTAVPFFTTPFDEWGPILSPDGRYLVYCSMESGRPEVYVQSFPDRNDKWQVSTRGGTDPSWSADGKQIYYMSAEQQVTTVPIERTPTFQPGVPQFLFPLTVLVPDASRIHYVVNADGTEFTAVVAGDGRSLPTTDVVVNWLQALEKK